MNPFDPFPRLETPRLELRRFEPADAADVFAIFSDPNVMRFWSSPPYTSITDAAALLDVIEERIQRAEAIEWGIVVKGDPAVVGKCCFHQWYKPHSRGEIGYALHSRLWGRGIISEALRAILAFGFEQMELHSVEAQVDPGNAASIAVLHKLGFVQEGHLRENFRQAGELCDTLIFSLLKRNYEAPR